MVATLKGASMSSNYIISTIGLLSTAMTIAGCSDKEETEENDSLSYESIANNWSATYMSYGGEVISFPYTNCTEENGNSYCYGMELNMVIDEAQKAMVTMSYTATLNDIVVPEESQSESYNASVVNGEENNSYNIILDDDGDFFGNLNCTLTEDILNCTVIEDSGHSITFSR
jgi:hypothetical protein